MNDASTKARPTCEACGAFGVLSWPEDPDIVTLCIECSYRAGRVGVGQWPPAGAKVNTLGDGSARGKVAVVAHCSTCTCGVAAAGRAAHTEGHDDA